MTSDRHKASGVSCSLLLLPVFIFWSQLIQNGFAELRFCMPQFGPQRMKDTDCPGGFVFNEPVVSPPCKFYAKTGDHTGKVLTAPTDICGDGTDRVIDNEGDDLDDISTMTYFLWEDFEGANETSGVFKPKNVCEDECLADWEDPHAISDEDPIHDNFNVDKVPEYELKELKKLNKEMFLRLLMDDIDDHDDDDDDEEMIKSSTLSPPAPKPEPVQRSGNQTGPRNRKSRGSSQAPHRSLLNRAIHDSSILNVIKILSKSMQITMSACVPFVQEDFMEQVLQGMIYISRKMEHTFLDIAPDLYTRISKTLDHCGLRRQQEFTLNGSRCDDEAVVEGIYFTKTGEYWPHRLHGWSFRWGRWHPILDAAWSVIDFVHSFCFESFMQDMMMLHVYEMSLEGLFPDKIQTMWRVFPNVNNDWFWNNLLQTFDLNITMRNLDACQEGALRLSPFLNSLPRPFLSLDELEKPAPPPVSIPVVKGWNRTMATYWQRYDSLGGFPKISERFGKCFEAHVHLEEEEDMIETLKQKCP